MAQLTLSFKNSDGIFTNTLDSDNITWNEYTFGGNTSKQLYKMDVVDVSTDNIGMDFRGLPFYGYSEAKQKWIDYVANSRIRIDNAYGINLVLADDGIYVAKDTELEKIPNYESRTLYISRIYAPITKDNFNNYRTLRNQDNNAGVRIIPFWATTRWNMSDGSKSTVFYGIKRHTDAANDYLCVSLECATLGTNTIYTYNDGGTPFPQVNRYWKKANTIIQDLDTRVSILESTVANLNARLTEAEKTIKDLPAVVAAVSSNVSKLYVAR